MIRGGIGALVVFLFRFFIDASVGGGQISAVQNDAGATTSDQVVRLLAVGDINLGREVGQRILRGDTLFPFTHALSTFQAYDIVFGNLECTLSDQQGQTQHPRNNLIFTGPPAGAEALRRAGITVVSTANNHALDYGLRAHRETMRYLTEAGISFTGTAAELEGLYLPAIIELNGILLAFFACTDIMNIEDPMWKRHVAEADTGKLLPGIRAYRSEVDFIVVSYHGGEEYASRPTERTVQFMDHLLEGGANLVLGHHPHVPHGVKMNGDGIAVHSLGNFAFHQPFSFWTQWGLAFEAVIEKSAQGATIREYGFLPVAAGLQPRFVTNHPDAGIVLQRVRALSSPAVAERIVW